MKNRLCSVEGCDGKHLAHGYCNKHYKRNRTFGTPHVKGNDGRTKHEMYYFYNMMRCRKVNEDINVQWNSFEDFIKDFPIKENNYLLRRSNEEGYVKGNLYWSDTRKHSTEKITVAGVTASVGYFLEKHGITKHNYWQRVKRLGHTPEEAILLKLNK